jgi:hypothetical protein
MRNTDLMLVCSEDSCFEDVSVNYSTGAWIKQPFSGLPETIYNRECAIFQGGLIRDDLTS